MGWGTGNLGGGSGGLNFKVVGYATEAELLSDTPKENTIGIITTNKITGWMFAAVDPAEPVEGMVYITTGAKSDIAFNALKKNGIMVYPLSAKQCVGGALVETDFTIYRNGDWVELWGGELYDYGNQYEGITGGWFAHPNTSAYVVFNADNIQFVNGANTQMAAAIYTQKKIDITRFSYLRVKGTVTDYDGNNIKIGITNSNTTGNDPSFVASTAFSKTGNMDAEVDLSAVSNGSYYISIWSKYANFKITQIMLEV